MDRENQAIAQAKSENKTYTSQLLNNGANAKQLLVRSRYLLYKSRDKWRNNQKERKLLLFELYPDLKKYILYHSNYELSTTIIMVKISLF